MSAIKTFIKYFFKTFIRSFLLVFCLSFGLLIFQAFIREYDAIWEESTIPYEQVKSEYMSTLFITNQRAKLFKSNFEENSFLQKWFKNWHESVYKRAITKLPEEEKLLRLWFSYNYNIAPYTTIKYDSIPTDLELKILNLIDKVIKTTHKLPILRTRFRYYIIDDCLNFFIWNWDNNLIMSDKNLKAKVYNIFVNILNESYQNLSSCHIYNTCEVNLSLLYNFILLHIKELEYNYTFNKDLCDKEITNKIVLYFTELAKFNNSHRTQILKDLKRSGGKINNSLIPIQEIYIYWKNRFKQECAIDLPEWQGY